MLSIKQGATESSLSRGSLCRLFHLNQSNKTIILTPSSWAVLPCPEINNNNPKTKPFFVFICYYSTAVHSLKQANKDRNMVALSFKEWFKRGAGSNENFFLNKILEILSNDKEEGNEAAALSQLGLRINERLVVDVLSYFSNVKKDVLSCIKFFDWAGRQRGFHHTYVTYHSIFKILSKAKLMPVMLDFLDKYKKHHSLEPKLMFYNTLVMGYAVAGKPQVALQLFGRMRFVCLDLNPFAYHILLNALVEESFFDAVSAIAKQISLRGFESDITHSIVVKSLCKQKLLDDAEAYLRSCVSVTDDEGHGQALSILVEALCKNDGFDKAGKLIEEFRELGVVAMDNAYSVWLRNLVQAGKIDGALEFFRGKRLLEEYVPEVFRFNTLLWRLLKENRLEDACDLLMEMMECQIFPDKVTMNAALCFFCKAGMVDVALDLYNSKSEFGLSPNGLVYNYLINSLLGDGSIDEAYHVLRNSAQQGHFPHRKTFSILVDALCREGKLDKMKELLIVALEQNFVLTDSTYDKLISVLCKSRRVEDGYMLLGELEKMNVVAKTRTYSNLIYGFNKLNRGDISARLLIEMQDKGHVVTQPLYRAVIRCLCNIENSETQFLKLLDMQLSRHESNREIYNIFIDGAGYAKKPELARRVFEMMQRSGIKPVLRSDIVMLRAYLKGKRVSDALNFFDALLQGRKVGKKLYNTMVVGLCKVNKVDLALYFLRKMQSDGLNPSIQCYEEPVKLLLSCKKYDMVVNLVNEIEKVGRHVSSFIGNILLLYSMKSEELYEAWVQHRVVQNETPHFSILGQLIGVFSGRMRVKLEINNLEEMIKLCFPLDIYTYNILLRRISMSDMDCASELFNRICQRGHEPNRWTYDTMVHGFFRHGRTDEAVRWLEKMHKKGFDPTTTTQRFM